MGRPAHLPEGSGPPTFLAAASQRLRGKSGRPRKPRDPRDPRNPGLSSPRSPFGPALDAEIRGPVAQVVAVNPRLLPLNHAAAYLGVSHFTLREMLAAGALRPVEIPLPPDRRGRRKLGVVRKVLLDVRDLDALVERAKAAWSPA